MTPSNPVKSSLTINPTDKEARFKAATVLVNVPIRDRHLERIDSSLPGSVILLGKQIYKGPSCIRRDGKAHQLCGAGTEVGIHGQWAQEVFWGATDVF